MPKGYRGWGFWTYIPGNRFPLEATAYSGRAIDWHAANFQMNQIPVSDVLIRNRVLAGQRKVAAQGPVHTGKAGYDAGTPPARTGLG